MREIVYIIKEHQNGKSVKQILKGAYGYSSRTLTRLRKDPLGLRCNGSHIRTIDPVHTGDRLQVRLPEEQNTYRRSLITVPILYEDDDLMVYNKPVNMPSHTAYAHHQDTLANVFAAHCDQLGLQLKFRIVNRLDKDTTGCVLVAKNQYAASALTGRLQKVYLAIVEGALTPPTGTVEAPILREREILTKRIVHPHGQYARTDYGTLGRGPGCSLVRCQLPTGRTHQIRVHMSYLGHPLLGDSQYGGTLRSIARPALHCRTLRFLHPVSGQYLTVQAPIPGDMQGIIDQMTELTGDHY